MKKYRIQKHRQARAIARQRAAWQRADAVLLASACAYAQSDKRCSEAAALAAMLRQSAVYLGMAHAPDWSAA